MNVIKTDGRSSLTAGLTYGETMRILVVDDFPSMRHILRNLLNTIGISDVEKAGDGAEAYAKLRKSKFDLVIADWNMEPVTGLELIHQVRSDASVSSTPFIMVTAESKTENVIKAKRAGVNSYIVKPFTADVLKAKIAAVMG
jgi:two-component system chemotaxis response regulator CheY